MNKEFISEKYREYRVLVIGIAASILLTGVYFIRTGSANDLKAEYDELTAEVDLLTKNAKNGGELIGNLEKVKQYTELMNGRFISQNLADIHDVFYTLERESGVSLEGFQRPEMHSEPIKPTANEVEYQPLSMAVTISGTFKNVLKFIHSLENSPLLFRYSALMVSARPRTPEIDAVSLTLNLELLSFNEQ
jgi:hypothetical protein